MTGVTRDIVEITNTVFGVDIRSRERGREHVLARRAASLLCYKYGVPARCLAEEIGVSRWTVNRMQAEALKETGALFRLRYGEAESTLKARLEGGRQ